MAERRMFAKSIVLSDAFLDMPLSARCLYFTLGMLADDDGFVGNPKSIIRQCGATQDDLLILLQKRFLLTFDSGIIVIKHWRINNYLRSDRHTSTNYKEELRTLMLDENNAYTEQNNLGIPPDNQRYTQDSIGKDRLDKVSAEGEKKEDNNQTEKQINNKRYPNISLSDDDYEKLKREMTDYCNGVPSYQFYLEYMSDWGQRNGKTYTYFDIKDWYNKDKQTNKRVFTSTPPAAPSYEKSTWAERAMRETPVYRRKDE